MYNSVIVCSGLHDLLAMNLLDVMHNGPVSLLLIPFIQSLFNFGTLNFRLASSIMLNISKNFPFEPHRSLLPF